MFERDHGRDGRRVDFANAELLAPQSQAVYEDETLGCIGQFSVPVDDRLVRAFQPEPVFGAREFLVVGQALRDVRNVVGRQQGGRVQIDFGRRPKGGVEIQRFAAFQRFDGRHQHAVVEFVPHFGDFPRLVFAEHLARTADFQVVHGKVKARAELLQRLNRFEALFRVLRVGAVGGRQEVRIGLVVGAPDAPAQLMKLRKAELVRTFDDDRIGGRDVDPRFDDGRAEEHVVALLVKLAHHPFEFALRHLPVRNHDARLGNEALKALAAVFDRLDFVVKEIDLTAALQFAQNRFANDPLLLALHEGFHRKAPLGRGGDDGKVADSFETHR